MYINKYIYIYTTQLLTVAILDLRKLKKYLILFVNQTKGQLTYRCTIWNIIYTNIWGKPIGDGKERVRAGRGTDVLLRNDHQLITQLFL